MMYPNTLSPPARFLTCFLGGSLPPNYKLCGGRAMVSRNFVHIVPLKQIENGVYGDLTYSIPKAIFYLLKGDYMSGAQMATLC